MSMKKNLVPLCNKNFKKSSALITEKNVVFLFKNELTEGLVSLYIVCMCVNCLNIYYINLIVSFFVFFVFVLYFSVLY